jgi:hypothetical protein
MCIYVGVKNVCKLFIKRFLHYSLCISIAFFKTFKIPTKLQVEIYCFHNLDNSLHITRPSIGDNRVTAT